MSLEPAVVGAVLRGVPPCNPSFLRGRRQPPGTAAGSIPLRVLVAGRIVRRTLRREGDRRPCALFLVKRAGGLGSIWVRLRGGKALAALRECRRGVRVVCFGAWLRGRRGRRGVLIAQRVGLEP